MSICETRSIAAHRTKLCWHALAKTTEAAIAMLRARRRTRLLGLSYARTTNFLTYEVLTSTSRAAAHHLRARHGRAGVAGKLGQ